MNKNSILETATIVYKEVDGKIFWFIVKQSEDGDWEFPRVVVRKGESSVRAALRMIGQQAAMNTRVLEEVGRIGGVATLNGKTVPRRILYYLMVARYVGNEAIGFLESDWCDYTKAAKRLVGKTDISMLKDAREVLKVWKKEHAGREFEDEEEEMFPESTDEVPTVV